MELLGESIAETRQESVKNTGGLLELPAAADSEPSKGLEPGLS